MELAEYYALIRPLPLPTEEQLERFAAHVLHAHSWYKHLPFHGSEFVVFLDPDAGGGFTGDQPRLHHTWQTRSEYVDRFGHLSYMYCPVPGAPFWTDYQLNARVALHADGTGTLVDRRETTVLELPKEIRRDAGFTLYPFACDNRVFFDRFEEMLGRLELGEVEHPCAALLVEYYRAKGAHHRALAEFRAESRRRFAAGVPCRGTPSPMYADKPLDEWGYFFAEEDALAVLARDPEKRHELGANALEYFRSRGATSIAWSKLARHEHDTVNRALAALRRHLGAAGLAAPGAECQEPIR